MSMNKYGGVNDMPEGFTKTELGKRVYALWFGMLRRCYDVNQLGRKRGRTYSRVVVCERWFYLKNFYEDIQKLEGYKDWVSNNSMALDKDIIAQEVTKIYSPSTCKFLTNIENMREMNDRMKQDKREKTIYKTYYVAVKEDEFHIFDTEKDACDFLGVKKNSVASCWRRRCKCKGYVIIKVGAKTEGKKAYDIKRNSVTQKSH